MASQCTLVNLREWQEQLIKKLIPSNRKVIWVVGSAGNEGKTFLVDYSFSKLGGSRCIIRRDDFPMVLGTNDDNADTVDHFIFDLPRSVNTAKIRYETFDEIKDCWYYKDLECGFFALPNVLLVLSPYFPNPKGLAKDRWEIYEIKNDELIDVYIDGKIIN